MVHSVANVQVRCADTSEARAIVAARVVRRMAKEGYVPCSSGCERRVWLRYRGGWLSVVDEAWDGERARPLHRMARKLSRDLDSVAFWVLVAADGLLRLGLFESGVERDLYSADPLRGPKRARKPPPERHEKRWSRVFPDASWGSLFSTTGSGGEALLLPLALATGVSVSRLAHRTRWSDLDTSDSESVVLHFRRAAAVDWQTPPTEAAQLVSASALAALQTGIAPAPHPPVIVAVDAELVLHVSSFNCGLADEGLQVSVVDVAGRVDWQRVRVLLGHVRDRNAVEVPLLADGEGFSASLPTLALPPGMRADAWPVSPTDALRAQEARFGSQVHVSVVGRAAEIGPGVARIAVAPALFPDRGMEENARYDVISRHERPLRAKPDVDPSLWVPLRSRTMWVAWMVLDRRAIPDVVRQWVGVLEPRFPVAGKSTVVRFSATRDLTQVGRPQVSAGRAARFFSSKRWRDVLRDLDHSAPLVDILWDEPHARLVAGGRLFGAPDDLGAVAVALPASDGLPQTLRALVDAVPTQWEARQALVVAWRDTGLPDATPYERACGILGQCTLRPAWVDRWLRGVGRGTVWLGPSLAAHLDPLPGAVSVGAWTRWETPSVSDAERLLAPILPSAEDWHAEMRGEEGPRRSQR